MITVLPVTFFTRKVKHGGFHDSGCAMAVIVLKSIAANNAIRKNGCVHSLIDPPFKLNN